MQNLRKTVLFLSVFFVLAACSKKDDPTPSIVGKWTVQTSSLTLQVNGQPLFDVLVGAGVSASAAQSIVDSYSDGFIVDGAGEIFDFKSDGTYTEQNGVNDPNPSNGTWTQDKTAITFTSLTDPNFKPTGTIISITDTDMSLQLKVKSVVGQDFQVDYVVNTTMKRS